MLRALAIELSQCPDMHLSFYIDLLEITISTNDETRQVQEYLHPVLSSYERIGQVMLNVSSQIVTELQTLPSRGTLVTLYVFVLCIN